jgi:crotonobetaine/carnitine-CoA ligase
MIARILTEFDPRTATVDALIRDRARTDTAKTFATYMPEGTRLDYQAFDVLTQRISSGLDAHSVPRGAHVAILMDNSIEQLLAIFGVCRGGRVAVPLNSAARGQLLKYFLTHADCDVLIVESGLHERVADIRTEIPRLRTVYVATVPTRAAKRPPPADGTRQFSELLEAPIRKDWQRPRFSDLAMLMFTSGTTGPSKAIMFSHAQIVYWGLDVAFHHEYVADDIAYVFLPLFHGNALLGNTMGALAARASIALTDRFSVSRFWGEVRASRATVSNGVGSIAEFLWSQPASDSDRDHLLRRFHLVPVPRFAREFEARYGLKIMSAFGPTDYCLGAYFNSANPREKLGAAGLPRRNVDLRVVDQNDMETPIGAPGEIVLRNLVPWAASLGYYKAAEQTVESRRNLWFHTGDRGYFDSDGYLWYVDRIKDSIRRRGENVSAYEVEEVVRSHPAVLDVAVYAVRAESAEDEVAMSVVLRPDASSTPDELVRHCCTNLAYFMVPRYVEIVRELPMTLSMKVEKYKLRQRAESCLAGMWDREASGIRLTR